MVEMMSLCTLQDLAKTTGLSTSTISRAIHNDRRVKSSTREAIQHLAAQRGYIPNLTARNLVTGSTHTIWLLLSDLENPLERYCATKISNEFAKQGYEVLISIFNNNAERFISLYQKLPQHLSDGAIIIPSTKSRNEFVDKLAPLSFPLLFLDRDLAFLKKPLITSDTESAIRQMAEKAFQFHCDVFFVGFPANNSVSLSRREQAEKILSEKGFAYFFSKEKFLNYISNHPDSKPGFFGDSSSYIENLFSDFDFSTKKGTGLFFDHKSEFGLQKFSSLIICKQDFDGMSVLACKILLQIIQHPESAVQKEYHILPKALEVYTN